MRGFIRRHAVSLVLAALVLIPMQFVNSPFLLIPLWLLFGFLVLPAVAELLTGREDSDEHD